MDIDEQVEYTALLNSMVVIGALTEADVKSITENFSAMSPAHAKESAERTRAILRENGHKPPSILQKLGLKKS